MDVNSNKQFVLTTVYSCVWLSPVAPPLLVPAPLLRPLGVLFQTIKSTFYHNQINIFQAATLLLPKEEYFWARNVCNGHQRQLRKSRLHKSPTAADKSLLSEKPLKLPMHPC